MLLRLILIICLVTGVLFSFAPVGFSKVASGAESGKSEKSTEHLKPEDKDELQEPVTQLQKPVAGVNGQLNVLKHDLAELKQVVNVTSTLILVAIVAIGLLVVLGTPIVAVFAWRYRGKIIKQVEGPKLK